ncbi:MAG: hypothetical protein HC878_00330 [Leptolyngbyaceae cyanobacterium SL_5_14]|nr:hypothetical protein [Leptolyngbyaceae cyanobacterium SL_5_14]
MTLADFTNFVAPGIRVIELDQGYRILDLASFNTVYMFGSAQDGEYSPTLVTSFNDFNNQFPASLSAPYVKNIFLNDPDLALKFVRVGIASKYLLTVLDASPGTLSFNVLDELIVVTIQAGESLASVADTIQAAVNQNVNLSGSVVAYSTGNSDEVLLASTEFSIDIVVESPTPNLDVTEDNATTPSRLDYVTAIQNIFSLQTNPVQGIVIAPEAFATLLVQSDRRSVGLALENLASTFDFYAVIDIGQNQLKLSQILAEAALYSSPKGHSEFFGNWVNDLNDQTMPASTWVAPLITLAIRTRGLKKSRAGTSLALKNAKSPQVDFNDTQIGVLTTARVNVFRVLENSGIVASDIITLATNPNYAQHQGRIIMNVINGTIRGIPGVYAELFEPIDANEVYLMRLGDTLKSILRRFWQSGSLFGADETDAFEVICDLRNNPLDQLNLGYVQAAIYAATTPNSRKILISLIKVPINQVQSVAATGNLIEV